MVKRWGKKQSLECSKVCIFISIPLWDSSRWRLWDAFSLPVTNMDKHGQTSWSELRPGGGGGDRETHRSTEALQDLHSLGVQGASKRPLWFRHLPVFLFKNFGDCATARRLALEKEFVCL